MAKKRNESGAGKALSSATSALKSIAGRIPFLKRPGQASSPEPFSAIEDDTPVGDLLSEANAAPGVAPRPKEKAGVDLGAVADAAAKNPLFLAVAIIVLVFLVAIAVTTIIVNAPPRPIRASTILTEEGKSLASTWILPPGDPLEGRIEFEREGANAYTAEDAAEAALGKMDEYLASLTARNDAAADGLYGTVR